MGKRYVEDFIVAREIKDNQQFTDYVKGAFEDYPGYPLIIQNCKAVIRYHIGTIEPGYTGLTPGLRGPSLQSVIILKKGIYLTVSTEYGFHGSGSKCGHGTAGQRQMIKILKAYEERLKHPQIEEKKEEPKPVDVASQILEMKKLLDSGVITQEEFDAFKKKILSNI